MFLAHRYRGGAKPVQGKDPGHATAFGQTYDQHIFTPGLAYARFGMAELNPGNGKQLRGLGQGKIDGHDTGGLLRV
jgi:hypothetical protein